MTGADVAAVPLRSSLKTEAAAALSSRKQQKQPMDGAAATATKPDVTFTVHGNGELSKPRRLEKGEGGGQIYASEGLGVKPL